MLALRCSILDDTRRHWGSARIFNVGLWTTQLNSILSALILWKTLAVAQQGMNSLPYETWRSRSFPSFLSVLKSQSYLIQAMRISPLERRPGLLLDLAILEAKLGNIVNSYEISRAALAFAQHFELPLGDSLNRLCKFSLKVSTFPFR